MDQVLQRLCSLGMSDQPGAVATVLTADLDRVQKEPRWTALCSPNTDLIVMQNNTLFD